jgi:NADPH-dependent 2,4-dienoyl-CoA reductase/sulfur reductase-like enzyme
MARKYIIVGTGAAGLAAAETIHECDPDGEILIFGDDPYGFYSRPGVAYFLTGELAERQLSLSQGAGFCRIGVKVTAVHPESHLIVADGKEFIYDRLLLATGSVAAPLTVPGADFKGVVKLDNIDDARNMIKMARTTRAAVVVGGGIIALEMVEGFIARGLKTHYLLRSNRYWPNVLDKEESEIVERRLKDHGVLLHPQTEIARIIGDKGRVAAVETKSGEVIKCQLVGVAVGVQPRIELAKDAGLRTDKGILTDEYLRTGTEDVFAAGDAAQVLDPVSGKTLLDTLWGTALAHGRIAGRNMADDSLTPFNKTPPCNIMRLAGITTTIIGAVGQNEKDNDLVTISRGDSESWRQIPDVLAVQTDYAVNHIRIMVGAHTIEGALLMGDQTLSRPLRELITEHIDVTPIVEFLRSSGGSLADILIDFWMARSRSVG